MTVKILHTSDWHVGRRIGGHDRSEEHRAVLDEIAGIASENSVDLVLVAGDLFDTSTPAPAAEAIVWRALLDLSSVAPVVILAGNHDNPARLEAVAPLLEMGRVTVCSRPAGPDDGGVLHLPELETKVAMLPFVSQRGIVRATEIMGQDPDDHAVAYADRMGVLIDLLTADMSTDTVNILTSHMTVYGALTGGERQAHVFGYAVASSVFPGHLSYVALGHLHRQQPMPHGAAVWYSGSPLQLDFGEVDDRKGVLIVEATPGLPARVTAVPLTSGRRLITVVGDLEQVVGRADEVGDAYVKVVLDESARVGLADEVRNAIPNAVDVQLRRSELVSPDPYSMRTAVSGPEAFHRYLDDKGVDDPEVEALFAELLAEVSP